MSSHEFQPSGRPTVQFVDDEELAYVMTRYREIHDFYHVLSGCPPSILGEVLVKWIEFFQTGLPMTFFSGVFGPIQLSKEEKLLLLELIPWAYEAGQKSKPMMCIYFEKYLNDDLEEFRKKIKFNPCPKTIQDIKFEPNYKI